MFAPWTVHRLGFMTDEENDEDGFFQDDYSSSSNRLNGKKNAE